MITNDAWLAGLFEGEGSFSIQGVKGKWFYPRAAITSTDLDVLIRAQALTGGTIQKKIRYKDHHKQGYELVIASKLDFNKLISLIEPYLGLRRKQRLIEVLGNE